ncbi:CCL5 protein, partial [Menura novaehollandiae]|nr:CCL5 protein [Menura novaehollandiae]
MKISLLLLTLLLAAVWTGSQGSSFRSPGVKCCSSEMFFPRKIPAFRIKSYQYTASRCSHKAALVKLPKGTVCVNPEAGWFRDYLKQKKPTNTSM